MITDNIAYKIKRKKKALPSFVGKLLTNKKNDLKKKIK